MYLPACSGRTLWSLIVSDRPDRIARTCKASHTGLSDTVEYTGQSPTNPPRADFQQTIEGPLLQCAHLDVLAGIKGHFQGLRLTPRDFEPRHLIPLLDGRFYRSLVDDAR